MARHRQKLHASAGIAKQQSRLHHAQNARLIQQATDIMVAHMDELNAENAQLIRLINRAHKMLAEGRDRAARLLLGAAINGKSAPSVQTEPRAAVY